MLKDFINIVSICFLLCLVSSLSAQIDDKPNIPWASKPEDLPQADIPAFPGAEGGGMYSFGGRDGVVYTVTSLEDSGPGTLREACKQEGPRIIVFNVSGIIRLDKPIDVNYPYITIAGQTAPGDGVCVAGESFHINTHDVVIRFMRFRRGEIDYGSRDDCVGGHPVGNIIVDHVSTSWGLDENISIYRHTYDGAKLPTVNITIQNSISSEALDIYNHAFGSTIGGENNAYIRNLWACNTGRVPSIGWYSIFNLVNNVIFNWYHRTADGGDDRSFYNIINNYYKPGPVTPLDEPIAYRILRCDAGDSPNVYGKAYVNGNYVDGFEEVSNDNWAGGVQLENHDDIGPFHDAIRVYAPFEMPYITIVTAQEAYNYVLENAGATLPVRDTVDRRIIHYVKTGQIDYLTGVETEAYHTPGRRLNADSYKLGIITHPCQVGGYPEYNGEPYADTDGDGIPDDWEENRSLDMNNPNDAGLDSDGDGYTNIEEYINDPDYFIERREQTISREMEIENTIDFYQCNNHLYFSESVDVEVYSITGVLCVSDEGVDEISLEGLERGIYILKAVHQNGDILVTKILF